MAEAVPKWKQEVMERKRREQEELQQRDSDKKTGSWMDDLVNSGKPKWKEDLKAQKIREAEEQARKAAEEQERKNGLPDWRRFVDKEKKPPASTLPVNPMVKLY